MLISTSVSILSTEKQNVFASLNLSKYFCRVLLSFLRCDGVDEPYSFQDLESSAPFYFTYTLEITLCKIAKSTDYYLQKFPFDCESKLFIWGKQAIHVTLYVTIFIKRHHIRHKTITFPMKWHFYTFHSLNYSITSSMR